MAQIYIIGSSHIARESIARVQDFIEKSKPDIVAVELDADRLATLLDEGARARSRMPLKEIFRIGVVGFLFGTLASKVSKKLGKLVGVSPGEEMKSAVLLARKHGLQVALIDQHISLTLARLSRAITCREVWQFVKDFFKGIFMPRRAMKDFEGLDLSKVPDSALIEKLIERMRRDYPGIYRVLIHERNIVMAHRLLKLVDANPQKRILAVMGAGHVVGVREIITKNLPHPDARTV